MDLARYRRRQPNPLHPRNVLQRRDLLGATRRPGSAERPRWMGHVVYGRPVLYPIPINAMPQGPDRLAGGSRGYLGMLLTFDVEPAAPWRTRLVAAFLRVSFADRRVQAIEMRIDREGLGIGRDDQGQIATTERARRLLLAANDYPEWLERIRSHEAGPTVSSSGLGENAFGWLFGDAEGTGAVPGRHATHVIVESPIDLPELVGTLRVDASIIREGLAPTRNDHVRSAAPVSFSLSRPIVAGTLEEPASGRHVPATPTPVPPRELPARYQLEAEPSSSLAGIRLCFAADIERFRRFGDLEAFRAQRRFVDVLAKVRDRAGVQDGTLLQPSGDGLFMVLPGGLDESDVVPRLIEGLRDALADVNADLNRHARLRVRAALHRGLVFQGPNGWVGDAAIGVHRILDSADVRLALTDNPEADFAVIVSDALYEDAVAHSVDGIEPHRRRIQPAAFRSVEVSLPDKEFTERAWIYLPDV